MLLATPAGESHGIPALATFFWASREVCLVLAVSPRDGLEDVTDFVWRQFPKCALLLSNGAIVSSHLEDEDALLRITRYVKNMEEEIQVGYYLRKKKLVIYRVTPHVFLMFFSRAPDDHVYAFLQDFTTRFAARLMEQFAEPPTTLKDITRAVVFSVMRDQGPEPICWHPRDFAHDLTLDVSMKSLLLLVGELEGAQKEVLSHRPFIKQDALGLIYLFELPDARARGGAFDCTITILLDYAHRGIVYEKSLEIETLCRGFARTVREFGLPAFEQDKTRHIADFHQRLLKVSFHVTPPSDAIREKMMESIDELRRITTR